MPQGQDDKGAGAFDLGRAGAPPPPQTRNGKSPLVAGRAAEGVLGDVQRRNGSTE